MALEKLKVKKNTFVSLCYKLCSSEYKIFEERTATDPIVFLQGYSQILPAVELAIEGQEAGFSTSLKLQPEQSYGEYQHELVSDVPRSQFSANLDLKVGMKFDTVGPKGQPLVVRILKIEDNFVTLDGNHPLAGRELIFELEILLVREASDDEVEEFLQAFVSPKQLH